MKFTATTALLALLTSTVSGAVLPRAGTRTVVLTNESSGHGQAADIPTTGQDVNVQDTYPDLFNPFRIDSIMITAGVVSGARCTLHGRLGDHRPITLAEVNGEKNYAKVPQGTGVVPGSLEINCV
ncbi:hypothetical protein BDV18DRAFT_135374 [Aspergillus unguis]